MKRDYRHLIQHDADLLVLPWTQLKFNPLKPPNGVLPRRWAQVFGEIFGHATALLSGSKNYLMKQLVKLYQVYGLLEEVKPPYPSLLDLQLLIEHDKINYVRKTSNYRDTVLNRLEAMNRTAGSIFDCSEGYPIEQLLKRNAIFEIDGVSEDTQNFLMEILIASVYEYRMASDQRGGDLRQVFIMDEGKRVFSVYKERQEAAGLPTIDELIARMREFGEGLIVADQEATKLTESIKANTDTKILLPTGDARQFQEVAESMFLTKRQQELAQQVCVGEAIVQTGSKDPVPVKLRGYVLERDISDAELQDIQQKMRENLGFTERATTEAFEDAIGFEPDPVEDEPNGAEPRRIELSEEAERLLKDVLEHPFSPLSERYEQFSSMSKGNQAKTELVSKGMVVERQVRPRSVKRKLLELTQKARQYIEDTLERDVGAKGRGGIIHRFWQHRIKELFEDVGGTAKVEMSDADVYVRMVEVELVIEVAMGNNKRDVEHIKQHLGTYDVIWVACRNEEVRDGLKQRLEENGLLKDRITLRLFRDFTGEEIGSSG